MRILSCFSAKAYEAWLGAALGGDLVGADLATVQVVAETIARVRRWTPVAQP